MRSGIRPEGKPSSDSEPVSGGYAINGCSPTSIKIVLSLTIKSAVAVPPPVLTAIGQAVMAGSPWVSPR
jgi:hypothetical protein